MNLIRQSFKKMVLLPEKQYFCNSGYYYLMTFFEVEFKLLIYFWDMQLFVQTINKDMKLLSNELLMGLKLLYHQSS